MTLYRKLSSDSEEFANGPEDTVVLLRPSARTLKSRCLDGLIFTSATLAFVIGITMLLLVSQLIDSIKKQTSQSPHRLSVQQTHRLVPETEEIFHCGSSHAEALAHGCTLDIMADAWLPQKCYDADAARKAASGESELAQYSGAGPFEWFLDDNHTQPIEQDSLSSLDSLLGYTVQEYHVAHCIYDWQATVRAMNRVIGGESPVWIHSKLLDEHHIHHCSKVIAAQKTFWGLEWAKKAEVHFGLGECMRLDAMSKVQIVFD